MTLSLHGGDVSGLLGHMGAGKSTLIGLRFDGRCQTVAIARTIYFNAHVVTMDEPTAQLGPQEMQQAADLILQLEKLKKKGTGIFLIGHDIPDVFDLAVRIALMKAGSLVATARTGDVAKDEALGMIVPGRCPPGVAPGPGATASGHA